MNYEESFVESSTGSEPIAARSLIAITVEDVSIVTDAFISKERGNREGFVQITINDQTTLLPFSGKSDKNTPLRPEIGQRILYFGPYTGLLNFDVRAVETNAAFRKFLSNIETVTDLVKAAPRTLVSAAASPAANLIGGIAKYLRSQSKDAHESILLTSWDPPLSANQGLKIHLGNKNGTVGSLGCRIRDLGVQTKKPRRLRVAVCDPRFEWTNRKIMVRAKTRKASPKANRKVEITPEALLQKQGFSNLHFDAACAHRKKNLTLPASAVTQTLSWQRLHCFTVSQTRATKNHLALPLQVDFVLSKSDATLDALADLSDDAVKLGNSLGVALPSEVNAIRRALPSFLSQLADLTPHALSLSTFDGVVILESETTAPLPEDKGYLTARRTETGWQTTVRHPILLPSGEDLGFFLFDVAITIDDA